MAKNPQPFTNSVPEAVQAPVFNFYTYEKGATYQHNESRIDFVTDGDELYVCVDPVVTTTAPKAKDQGGLLKLVSKGVDGDRGPIGAQGRPGHTPRIAARFANKQMIIYADGEVVGVTGDLTGPAWVPERQGDEIVWNLSRDDERPESIKLDDLRVKEKPLLLRVDSDNTKRSDEESGPANMIQWKYEGDPAWTNLISISELMNLALAGVSIWQTEAGAYHLGHREVVKAKYSATKSGKRIISEVELGEVLFDAGEIVPGLQLDIDDIHLRLEAIEDDIERLKLNMPDLDDYLTRTDAARLYQPKGDYLTEHQSLAGLVRKVNGQSPNSNGEVTIDIPEVTGVVKSVKVNGTTHNPNSNGLVDLGTITGGNADTSDCVKSVTINGTTKTPVNGNVSFTIGEISLFDVRLYQDRYLQKTVDGTNWVTILDLNDIQGGTGLTEAQVKTLIGRILEGLEIPSEYVRGSDHNYFIRKSDLADYRTYSQILAMIQEAMTGNDVDYYRVFTLYQRTNSPTVVPNRPVVGVWEWDTTENTIALKPNANSDWDNHPINASGNNIYLWMTSATYSFKSKGEVGGSGTSVSGGTYTYDADYAWSAPICLTGENGQNGEDGKGIEFIFHLGATAPNIDYTTSKKDNTTTARTKAWWATEASADWCPGDGNNGYWTDDPTGIDDTNADTKIEWARIRKSYYDSVNEVTVWEDFGDAFIWAMWGEDGIDGAGVEYIFRVAANDAVTNNQLNASEWLYLPTEGRTSVIDNANQNLHYQMDDWVPDGTVRGGYQMPDYNFTDNPSDVGPDQPYEFVCIRKKRVNPSTGVSEWGPFSEPKLWGYYGTTTIQTTVYGSTNNKPYTCYAFTRTNTNISNYVVTYDFSTFGDANTTYNDLTNEQKSAFYENPLNYIKTTNNNVAVNIPWSDTVPNNSREQLWLITNHIGDEASITDSGWTSPQKWGDQAGIQIEYAVSSTATDHVYHHDSGYTLPNLNTLSNGIPKYETDDPLLDHDGDGIDESTWRYDVEHANPSMGVWGDEDDIEDPDYMAVCFKRANGVWTEWQISRIKGEQGPQGENGANGRDGADIEFVYYRTDSESHAPMMSPTYGTYDGTHKVSEDLYADDFFPMAIVSGTADETLKIGNDTFWHDHPVGVTENLPCEWVGIRHSSYQNGQKIWSSFNIALWSKYGANGRDGDGIEYVFWGLTEQQNAQITYTWPTQKVSSAKNGGHNIDPTRKDSQLRSIGDDEYLPAILINNQKVEAVDDNPGIDNYKYVYASMRKYDGSAHAWGEFGEIKLWNEQNDSESNYCVLQIENDSESVLVNDSNVVDDSFNTFDVVLDDLWLRNNTTLLTIDKIAVNDVDFVTFSGSTINPVANASATITLYSGHNLTVTYAGAYVSSDRYNTKQIRLHLAFTDDSVISAPIQIPISAYSGDFVGTDVLTLFPVNVNELVKIGTVVTRDFYTSTRGSYDYSETTVDIQPIFYQQPIKAVEKLNYWIACDQDKSTAFTSNTTFFGPFHVPAANPERPGAPGVSGTLEYDFYFKKDGTTATQDNEKFIRLRMFHTGNEMRDTDQWTGYAQVYFGNSAENTNKFLPIDNIIVGVGYPDENGVPVVTDREEFKIIYNGAQGPQGPQGPQGLQGDPGQTVITYQYLDGKVVRLSNWTDEQLEYSDGNTAVNGVKYLDVVKYVNNGTTSYYKCVSDVTYTSSNKPASPSSDSTHWTAYTPQSDAWFDTLLANSAYISNITSNQIVVTNSDSTVVGGMTSSSGNAATIKGRTIDDVRIWAGGTANNGNLKDAAFNVTHQGVVTSQGTVTDNGTIVGVRTVMDRGIVDIDINTGTLANPNWVTRAAFGYENGDIILQFFDSSGNSMYNLGPSGILRADGPINPPEWTRVKVVASSGNSFAGNEVIDPSTAVYVYKYNAGYRYTETTAGSGSYVKLYLDPFDMSTFGAKPDIDGDYLTTYHSRLTASDYTSDKLPVGEYIIMPIDTDRTYGYSAEAFRIRETNNSRTVTTGLLATFTENNGVYTLNSNLINPNQVPTP